MSHSYIWIGGVDLRSQSWTSCYVPEWLCLDSWKLCSSPAPAHYILVLHFLKVIGW